MLYRIRSISSAIWKVQIGIKKTARINKELSHKHHIDRAICFTNYYFFFNSRKTDKQHNPTEF